AVVSLVTWRPDGRPSHGRFALPLRGARRKKDSRQSMFPERARVQIVLASAIVGLTMLFGGTAAADAFQTNCSGGSIGNKNGPVMTGPVNVYPIWDGGKNAQQLGGFESQVVTYLNALSESSYMAMNTTYNQNQTLSQPYENV